MKKKQNFVAGKLLHDLLAWQRLDCKHKASKCELHLGSLEFGKSSQLWKTKVKSKNIMLTMTYLQRQGISKRITKYPVFHFMIVSICSAEFHRLCRHVLLEIEGNGVFYCFGLKDSVIPEGHG